MKEDKGFFINDTSHAKDQIFWEGLKGRDPRKLILWIEPIITIGACARLIEEFGWPPNRVGSQSVYPWPFDLACYEYGGDTEAIVGEVKKHPKEIDHLISDMQNYCSLEILEEEPKHNRLRNSYRKVVGIRKAWPKVFWVLGPNGEGHVFKISRGASTECFDMKPIANKALKFDNY